MIWQSYGIVNYFRKSYMDSQCPCKVWFRYNKYYKCYYHFSAWTNSCMLTITYILSNAKIASFCKIIRTWSVNPMRLWIIFLSHIWIHNMLVKFDSDSINIIYVMNILLHGWISTTFSRYSSFCWPYWASNKYLAGPIRPANDPLLLLAQ